jgi:alkanesulfonate monooxygenase SsuD/methylene tetrahydromethanopterin reductase-like flavin-dependent oxidoreductase (luciferase family)
MLTVITDETEEKAHAKHEEYKKYVSYEGALVLLSGWLGIDLSVYDPDEPLGNVKSNAIQSAVANFSKVEDDGKPWTVRDIAEWAGIGGLGPRVVGSGAQVAEELQAWVEETDVDGFNLAYAITPGSFEDVVKYVVPELQKRGAYPTEYVEGTLRHKLFGRGDRLPAEHHGSSYRLQPAAR